MTASLTKAEFLDVLRKACADAGSQAAWAELHNIPPSLVSEVLNGKRGVTETIMAPLNFEFVGVYRQKGAAS